MTDFEKRTKLDFPTQLVTRLSISLFILWNVLGAGCGVSESDAACQVESRDAELVNKSWPQFRGPSGAGVANNAALPTKFSESQNMIWKTPIRGKGWSSPVVHDSQVWLTTATEDGKMMSAICVELETGKLLHEKVIHENEAPEFCHPVNSYASPTPTIESGRVYVHFGSYGTSCLDTATCEVIWQRTDLKCDHFRGPASSPILHNDLLIVAFDGVDKQFVVGLNKMTGKTVWQQDRKIEYGTDNGDFKKAYGTGGVFHVDGEDLLVYPSAVATVAYRPETGEPVWTIYHGGMNASAPPVKTEDGLILISNGMGMLLAIDPTAKKDHEKSEMDNNEAVVWSFSKSVVRKGAPMLIANRIYMFSDKGIASCVDASNGKVVWQERLGGTFSASPVFDGKHLFAFDDTGKVHVLKPGDSWSPVESFKFGDGFRASPAVVGNKMVLRSLSHLYCVESSEN